MAQRHSEYKRMDADAYWTPQWVFDALYSVESFSEPFDCAPRNADFDFLAQDWICPPLEIVTNPPFSKAESFVRHALKLANKVAMLLPLAWDAAKSRRDLFENPRFKAKYVLCQRIRWENLEQKKNGPSSNHAWYVWDNTYNPRPFLAWLPKHEGA